MRLEIGRASRSVHGPTAMRPVHLRRRRAGSARRESGRRRPAARAPARRGLRVRRLGDPPPGPGAAPARREQRAQQGLGGLALALTGKASTKRQRRGKRDAVDRGNSRARSSATSAGLPSPAACAARVGQPATTAGRAACGTTPATSTRPLVGQHQHARLGDAPLAKALLHRRQRDALLLDLDDAVARAPSSKPSMPSPAGPVRRRTRATAPVGQVRRTRPDITVVASPRCGTRRPAAAATCRHRRVPLAPGDATGLGAAVDLHRRDAQQRHQLSAASGGSGPPEENTPRRWPAPRDQSSGRAAAQVRGTRHQHAPAR